MTGMLTDKEIKEILDMLDEVDRPNYILKYNGEEVTKFIDKPSKKSITEHLLWVEDESLNNMTIKELKEFVENEKYTLEKIKYNDN